MFRVSVVIPTYRRAGLLARCLAALTEQTLPYDQYEVIVCDDGAESAISRSKSKSDVSEVQNMLADWRSGGMHVRYVAVTGHHGPAAARNRGWETAQSECIAFTDDDTLPGAHWLEEGLAALEGARSARPAAVVAVAGRVVLPISNNPTDYEWDAARLADAEFVTANCFVLRSALEAIGGFDERFTLAWREDSDLQFSLLRRFGDVAIIRSERALVVHPIRPAPWGVSLRQVRKAAFNALLYKKHPTLYRERVRPLVPWRYYAMVVAGGGAVVCALLDAPLGQRTFLIAWAALVTEFSLRRLQGTRKSLSHLLEMFVTSVLLAPIAVYWRLYGAAKFRVIFF
jgi:GT2 family glycosyltransferase